MAKSEKQRAREKPRNAGPQNRGKKKGQGALRPGSAFTKSYSSSKVGRTGPNGEKDVKAGKMSHMRTENTINRLQMYRATTQELSREQSVKPCRIQPDRRWFGNTRVIAQGKMQAFRETLSKGVEDPYSVVLRSSKLPMSLLRDTDEKASKMNLLSVEPYNEVFGKRRRQKKAKLGSYDLEGLMQSVSQKTQGYTDKAMDKASSVEVNGLDKVAVEKYAHAGEEIFNKGTSKRIWTELYKVVDCSDVLIFVLDARDPMGTRCKHLEKEIRKNRPGKHIVLLLNKVDLIPTWAARRWVQVLTKEFPTLAFHASITNPFGKNALLNLLRQFGVLIKERKHLTIGMVGYPNVGKSSVINTMKHKKVCKAAPVPGETRVWQYIALTKKLYMLDCPGIVPTTVADFKEDCAKVLKGVVRPERIKDPSGYIDEVLSRVKKAYLCQRYKLPEDADWENAEEFLTVLARKMGKLVKGGDPDIEITARMVLCDWQRGRIPFFTPPPEADEAPQAAQVLTAGQHEPASSSSSSAQLAAAERVAKAETEVEPVNPAMPPPTIEVLGPVCQSLSELSCSMIFDEEDRRGEALPAEQETATERRDRKEDNTIQGRRKNKRKLAYADAGEPEGEGGEADTSQPKGLRVEGLREKRKALKKKKTRRGGGGGEAAKEAAAKKGAMDWKAVVEEFGM